MSALANKIINQRSVVLQLLTDCKNDRGEVFYAYVLFSADIFEDIKEKLLTEGVDIDKYGMVIYADLGEKPDEVTHEQVMKFYKENYLK